MAKKRLGLYFGAKELTIAEIESQNLISSHVISYSSEISGETPAKPGDVSSEIKLTALLQKTLRDKRIETKDVVASLPITDIFLRSFSIPWMKKGEIDSSVEFEVRKYIPFRLSETIFDYQSIKLKKQEPPQIRIIFIGTKKEILDKYLYILEQPGLNILAFEPAPLSMLRTLILKKQIDFAQNTAIVEVEGDEGNIIIVDKGVPQFIRDFKFTSRLEGLAVDEPDVVFTRLANEIRVSLDYYRRQFAKPVEKILLCIEQAMAGLRDNLSKELGMPIGLVNLSELVGLPAETVKMGLLKAYGAGLKDLVSSPITIDLYKRHLALEAAAKKKPIAAGAERPLDVNIWIRTAVIAAAFVGMVYLFNQRQVWDLKTQIKDIQNRKTQMDSKFATLKQSELEEILVQYQDRLSTLKDLSAAQQLFQKLNAIPRLLPKGVWLEDLDFKETDHSLRLKGRVYLENVPAQIELVNKFLSNLKANSNFSQDYEELSLGSISQATVGNWTVTDFEIMCK